MINTVFKFKTFFWALLAITSTLSGTQVSYCELAQESTSCCLSNPLFEVKTGYFFFSDSKLRKIYDKGGFDIQLCASCPFQDLTCRWSLHAYGAVEYFHRSGKSINGDQKTSVWSVPINVGLKPVYAIDSNLQYYFAIGPRYLYIQQHNNSSYVYKNKSKSGIGFFVNTGFDYALCDNFVVDIFGEYSYANIHFHGNNSSIYTRNIQVGGFTFGGGLGYEF